MYVETKDRAKLYVKDWGSGPPVVLIHGWPLDADMWEYQAVELASSGLRVIAYDRRGFGRSDQPWDGYDYDTLTDDLHSVVETLGLTDVSLVGFSMGGGEVARYMSRHNGQGVRRAVLVSAVTPYLLRTDDNPDGVPASQLDPIIEGLKKDRAHFLAGFGKKFFNEGLLSHNVSQETLQWALQRALNASPRATLACAKAFAETDFRADLQAFRAPTLIVHGKDDQTVPIDASGRRTAQLVPQAQYVEYDNAPHGLFFTHADKLNADLMNFLLA